VSWSKLSDDFSDDCWTLSDKAFRLHVEGLCWSNRKLLDCRIPKDDLRRFAKHPEAVDELLAVGWWTDEGDYYVIRHHSQYQRTREQVLAQQAINAANGRKGGRPRKPRELVDTPPGTESVNESPSEARTEGDRTRTGQALQVDDVNLSTGEVVEDRRSLSVVADAPAAVGEFCSEFVAGNKRCPDPPSGWESGRAFCAVHLEARTA